MNKLFTKITSLALGAAMMIGVGVSVGSKSVGSAYAETASGFISDAKDKGTSGSGSSMTASSDGITFSFTKGYGSKGTQIRSYSGSITMTYDSTVSAVTAIDMVVGDGKTGGTWTGASISGGVVTWDSLASGATISHNSQARITSLSVTYTPASGAKEVINKTIVGPSNMEKTTADSSVDISQDIKVDGNVFGGCTVQTSNSSAVQVSGTTLSFVGSGTSKITISHSDVETETTITKYASAEFTVTVTAAPIILPTMPNGNYEKITNTSGVVDGYYLITCGTRAFDASRATLDAVSNYVDVTISDDVIEDDADLNDSAVYIKSVGNNEFNIIANVTSEQPVYIGNDTTGNALKTSTEVAYKQTITISNGNAIVTATSNNSGKVLVFNSQSGQTRFRYMGSGDDIQLYKKASSAPVVDVYTTSISVSPKTIAVPLGLTGNLSAEIDAEATVRTITWTGDQSNNKVSVNSDGVVSVASDATVGSTATITATINNSATTTISDTCVVTVGQKQLTGLSRTGYDSYYIGQTIGDYVGGSITATWTAGSDSTISLDDSNLRITLGGQTVTKDRVLESSDNDANIQFTYTDPNYPTVSFSSNNRKISVGEYLVLSDLTVTYKDNKTYILTDGNDTTSHLNFSYKSWGGKATLSITSSDETKLIATESTHTFSDKTGSGTIGLLAEDGKQGSVIVTVVASVGEGSNQKTSTKSFSVLLRTDEPSEGGGTVTYNKISNLNGFLNEKDYVIVAKVSNKYYALPNNFTSGATVSGAEITVTNDTISDTVASGNIWTGYRQQSGTDTQLAFKGAGALYFNVSTGNTNVYRNRDTAQWHNTTISTLNDKGTFLLANSSRRLLFSAGSTNKFGSYASSNYTQNGQYYAVDLYIKTETGGEKDSLTKVTEFVDTWVKRSIDTTDNSDTNACRGENGYYALAKAHLSSDLNSTERKMFRDDFPAFYERMIAWGVANQENFLINDSGEIVTSPIQGRLVLDPLGLAEGKATTVIIIISVIGVSALGGFFFLRKRKEI